MKLLVIGYGNSLRGDDGVGPQVAERVAAWKLPQVRSLVVHQLLPELAPAIARADRVVFVDASRACTDPDQAELSLLAPTPGPSWLDHRCQAGWLIQLAQTLYGHCPIAYELLIPAQQFDYGAALSAPAQRGVDWALAKIREVLADA